VTDLEKKELACDQRVAKLEQKQSTDKETTKALLEEIQTNLSNAQHAHGDQQQTCKKQVMQ